MSLFKLDLLLLLAAPVVLMVGLVVLNTAGVSYLNAAHVELPPVMVSAQVPASSPTAQPPASDNTALWIALISSLTLNFFNLVSGMFNTWMQFKLKIATKDMQQSLEMNTAMTEMTKTAVRGQAQAIGKLEEGLADKSNVK